MGKLEAVFDVPALIERGLEAGQLERVGGVIREQSTGRVVMWLREASRFPDRTQTPLQSLLQRSASASLGRITPVSQTLMATGGLVHLALATATFAVTLEKLDGLSKSIAALSEAVQAEFQRERDMRFKIALMSARDVFESEGMHSNDAAVRAAIDGLYEAQENFLSDFQAHLKRGAALDTLMLAQHVLLRAMYAGISRIRCYLIADERALARRRLLEVLPRFEEAVRSLVTAFLGSKPALYFYKDVTQDDLRRFFAIQHWLRDAEGTLPEALAIFQIVDELRPFFWNSTVIEDEYRAPIEMILRRPELRLQDRLSEIPKRLEQCEILIENMHRLLGFESEIRSLNLSLDEWQSLVPDSDLDLHGFGFIVDSDWLRSSA